MTSQVLSWLWRHLGRLQWPIMWVLSPKYFIGVNALIVSDQGHIWLQRHRYWTDQAWGLPGGIIAGNESPPDALKRELREELGRTSTIVRPLVNQLSYRRGVTLCYLAKMGNEPVRLDTNEIIEARFCDPNSLPQPMLPSHRQLIRNAIEAFQHTGGYDESNY